MAHVFPAIYPILDASILPASGRDRFLLQLGKSLADARVTLLEYRNKAGADAEILTDCAVLRAAMLTGQVKLILDDRVDLLDRSGFDGVHVDAGDPSPAQARQLLGPERIVGTYGGTESLLPGILDEPADYWSVGPIGFTTTKQTSKPPIGTEGVRKLREQAGPKPILVAAGGVTFEDAAAVLAAGANTVAVSAALFRAQDPAAEFLRWRAMLGR